MFFSKFVVILLSLCLSCRIDDANANTNFADDTEIGDSKSGENESYGGNEVHEVFVKKNAYKSSGRRVYSSSSSSSSSSSNSGFGYGGSGGLSQSSSYSSGSSYGTGHGGPTFSPGYSSGNSLGYGQTGYDQTGHDKTGYGHSGHDQTGYGKTGYDQSGHDQTGYGETGYGQSGHGQSGYSGYHQNNVQLAPFDGSDHHAANPPPPSPSEYTHENEIEIIKLGSICDPATPNVDKPGNCQDFYQCTMDTTGAWGYVEKSCGPGTWFNPQTMVCDHIDNVKRIKPQCGNLVSFENSDYRRATDPPSQSYRGSNYGRVTSEPTNSNACTTKPQSILNASTRCTLGTNTCTVQCMNDYQFPNGETKAKMICTADGWILENLEWTNKHACEPICRPACKNNGICISPGKCTCAENFIGPYCEQEKKLCLTRPAAPHNSRLSCSSTDCTITCAKGHSFPDGSSITNMICKDGQWTPSRGDQTSIPDCKPICSPSCQNGGKCLSHNVCQCEKDFRGKQCQYNVEVCSPKKIGFNGAYNCSGNNDALRCSLTCPEGVEFSSQPAPEYVCEYERGDFLPLPIPQCKYSADMEVVFGKENSHSFSTVNRTTVIGGSSSSSGRRKVKKIRKKHKETQSVEGSDDEEDGGESYEKIITKTKIVVHKGRKTKKLKKAHENDEYEYEEYEDEEGSENEEYDGMMAIGVQSLYISSGLTVKHRVPKPATCTTWNGNKIKTFDGLIYNHNLYCSHTLLQDRIDGTFGVVLRACSSSYREPCSHAIDIMLSNIKYKLENINGSVALFKDDKPMTIPVQIMGLRVTKVGLSYKISLELIGLTINWDAERLVHIETTAALFNRTAGLCGTLDQDPTNDFASKDGTVHKTISTFIDAWEIPDTNCDNEISNDQGLELVCTDDIKAAAKEMCASLLSNKNFNDCLATLKEEAILDACISDYCYCKDGNRKACACNGLTVFAKECQFQGVSLKPDWRDMELCPITCGNGRIYKACGPRYEQTCGSAVESSDNSPANCNEGCFCPDGTIQHDNECIRIDDCPCTLRGKTFKAGREIKKDCNKCKCEKGVWKCSDETCGARCSAVGDPHYQSFDGKRFDFMGKCSYYLLKTDDGLEITGENVACPGSISETMNFGPIGVDMPSCTKSVSIRVTHEGQTVIILLKQGRQIQIDGNEITKIPVKIFNGLVRIRFASSTMLLVAFRDGLKVWWDGMTRVYIDAPQSYRGRTQGLCGTFDSNQQNDFLTPEGDIESSVASFANKWRTKEMCDFVSDSVDIPHPCQSNMQNKATAMEVCGRLKSKIFEECHWYVDPEPYYEDCMYDMCACKGDTASCMCSIFAAYASECSQQGSIIHWRQSVQECAIKCPAGQVYEECSDRCYRSCADMESMPLTCRTKCVEGCRCPEGQALDDNNECIPITMCPCAYDGLAFNAGYKEVRAGTKHLELCSCAGAEWKCDEAKDSDKDNFPRASDIRNQCLIDKNEEFTTCKPVEQKTCKNMNNFVPAATIDCRPGCICKKVYVLDVALKKCVLPTQCSCHHGGKSYSDGEQIISDCNKCTCESGNWACTKEICPATCTAYGDSHFTTYDGRDYDFQGACSYVLSKGVIESGEGFTVTIQNVMCGSEGVTCAKSVTISLVGKQSESITLNSGAMIPGSMLNEEESNEIVHQGKAKRMKVHRAGVFVVIEVPGLGVQLKWDRGTRIYVKLSSRWKGRVQGLCGNFDGDALNDFQSPSTGLETNAILFGNSWKLEEFCPQPVEQIDACSVHSGRKIWAEKKCGVLKSSVFAACHSEVNVDKFLKRCIFDSCACDQGGDCECLCTAIAAYAHACTMKGVPIRWRTPDFCPMQCDPVCSEYKPCISACGVETCDNLLDHGKDSNLCAEDACVEGCHVKPCPNGQIYSNSSLLECVPKSVCRPVCMHVNGIDYIEGDITYSDNCQTCHCSKGKELCIGVPCTATSILPYHTHAFQDGSQDCKSGWSEWLNQERLNDDAKSVTKLNDFEPLPNAFMLKNYKNSAFCDADFMTEIDCRSVDSRLHPKEIGEDAECSLERGLFCQGQCHDYEIRVFCKCNDDVEIITMPNVRYTTPRYKQPIYKSEKIVEMTTETIVYHHGSICDPAIPHVEKPGSCHEFYHCAMDATGAWKYVEKTCGRDKMYNPQAMVCDHIASVKQIKPECGGEPQRIANTEKEVETIITKEKIVTKVIKHGSVCDPARQYAENPENCRDYYQCTMDATGAWIYVAKSCNKNMMFNPQAMVCDHIESVRQIKPHCGQVEYSIVTEEPRKYTHEYEIETIQHGSICDPAIPHVEKPGSCQQFYHCTMDTNGAWVYVEKTCGENTMFNPHTMVCDHIANVKQIRPECGDAEDIVIVHKEEEHERRCPIGKVWSDCAVPCGRACHFYDKFLQSSGSCTGSWNTCVGGCVSESAATFCPNGHFWRDDSVCVKKADCTCQSDDGNIVKPNSIYKESECKICQCIDNVYVCDTQFCQKVYTTDATVEKPRTDDKIDESTVIHRKIPTKPPKVIINTITPPADCEANNFIPLINGADPLPDSAFNASSYLTSSFQPHFSRLNAKSTPVSSGSWSPEVNDQEQYLEIGFEKPVPIYGIILQGSPIFDQYVTSFKILYNQDDGHTFYHLVDETMSPEIFNGPVDSRTPVKSMFKIPIEAKIVRIYPLTWHGSIAIRAELLGCSPKKVVEEANTIPPHHEQIDEEPICYDAMGVESGMLKYRQIKLSSHKPNVPENEAKQQLKLSSPQGWSPNIDSPNEYVVFDFLQLRNVTGVKTKGGLNGWVSVYTVLYTQDFIIWNKLLNADGSGEQFFLGNFDANTEKVNYFRFPIQARAIKIIPNKWSDCIEMKVEPLGCYVEYPYIEEVEEREKPRVEIDTKKTPCNVCKGIETDATIEGVCKCKSNDFWNGIECVQPSMCPCVVNHVTYGVGAQFQSDDCSQCTCVLGGMVQCKPHDCKPCDQGLRPVKSAACLCVCEPCPENQILCQSSGACIPKSSWCDGIQDCPDDEINCAYKHQSQSETVTKVETIRTKTIIKKKCPEPKCPPGFYVKVLPSKKTKKSPMLTNTYVTTPSPNDVDGILSESGEDSSELNSKLPLPEDMKNHKKEDELICVEYDCIPERAKTKTEELVCPTPSCPSGYQVIVDKPENSLVCSKYKCELIPKHDVVCNITGSTFNTFDGTEFKYDVCDHILVRDLAANNWTVSLQKNCSDGNFVCRKQVTIADKSYKLVIILRTDGTIKLDNYEYTVDQLEQSIYAQMNLFSISKVGNSLLFVSHLQEFWVRLDENGDVKVGISSKYKSYADGLCGYYNEYANDDKRLPDGSEVISTIDFGDGWWRDPQSKPICQPQSCSQQDQDLAWEMCNKIKDETFEACSNAINADHFISKCLETACECFKSGGSGSHSALTTNKCKCAIMQSYVTECMAADENLNFDTWRSKFECVVDCPAPLVHRDCYRRRCEPSCDTLSKEKCSFVPGTCFAGCYCPEGTVRKGEICVPVNECKDCVCDGFGQSQYITYDRKNFNFDANCTYLLSRDIKLPDTYTFQVYASLAPCPVYAMDVRGDFNDVTEKPDTQHTCTQSLHILYGQHIIHLQRNNDAGMNAFETLVDGIEATALPFKKDWLTISEQRGKGLNIDLVKSLVEVSANFDDLSFSIKIPSVKYGGLVEGLCGNCNGDPSDDLRVNPKHFDKIKSDNLNDIFQSWVADEPALNLKEKCIGETVVADECLPLPPDRDPCLQLLDANVFGQCHMIVNAVKYVSMCQIDMCKSGPNQKSACSHLAAYARECSRNGICVDWKRGACIEQQHLECPADMQYKACGCQKTCQMVNEKSTLLNENCAEPVDGCFCGDGKVLNENGKCVTERECHLCDDRGHFIGDKWQSDKCTECACLADGKVSCTKKQCAVSGAVCEIGFKEIQIATSSNDCCPSFKCVPEVTDKSVACLDQPQPHCAVDQIIKAVVDKSNCTSFVCVCKPLNECRRTEIRPLRPGEHVVEETSGCCPSSVIVCDKTKCPTQPSKCAQKFYEVVKTNPNQDDLCCDEYECVPPKNLCLVDIDGHRIAKKIDEIWATEDPCVQKVCAYGADGAPIVTDKSEQCLIKECPLGESMKIRKSRCCGQCTQDKCVFDGKAFDVGSTWFGNDNCTEYRCSMSGEQPILSISNPTCPDVSHCPKELQYNEDCCVRCATPAEDKKLCLPVSLSESQTVGLVEINQEPHGKCVNIQPIRGFTECHGACNSGTKYNRYTMKQDKKCQCCSVSQYEKLNIPVKCNDGSKQAVPISVPKTCTCQPCEDADGNHHLLDFLKSTTVY